MTAASVPARGCTVTLVLVPLPLLFSPPPRSSQTATSLVGEQRTARAHAERARARVWSLYGVCRVGSASVSRVSLAALAERARGAARVGALSIFLCVPLLSYKISRDLMYAPVISAA